MNVLRKLRNASRNARWWVQGSIQRAGVGRHIRAAYIHSLPSTAAGGNGSRALQEVTSAVLKALELDRVFFSGDGVPRCLRDAISPFDGVGALPLPADDDALALAEDHAIWLQGPFQAERLRSLLRKPDACRLIYVEVGNTARSGTAADPVEFTDLLVKSGFEPIARDAHQGDESFHVLFLRARDLELGCLANLPHWIEQAVSTGLPRSATTLDVPILVPCFNNQTYCQSMISQLRERGIDNITLIDNASTSPEMHRFLDEAEGEVKVRRLSENLGPKSCIFAAGIFDDLPRYFCVTDPDIVFNPFLPSDFLDQLIALTREFEVGKAGFALDLSHRQFFRDLSLRLLFQDWKVWEWEERFWSNPIGSTTGHDKVFRADIDTTFALYDKQRWSREEFTRAVRVAGRFTAQHAPWYRQAHVPREELELYRNEGRFSYYQT